MTAGCSVAEAFIEAAGGRAFLESQVGAARASELPPEVLAALGVKAFATGPTVAVEELGELPAHTVAVPWVPQAEVLREASLVVQHGGAGTMLAAQAGELLTDGGFRGAARHIADEIAAMPSPQEVAASLGDLAGGPDSALARPSRRLRIISERTAAGQVIAIVPMAVSRSGRGVISSWFGSAGTHRRRGTEALVRTRVRRGRSIPTRIIGGFAGPTSWTGTGAAADCGCAFTSPNSPTVDGRCPRRRGSARRPVPSACSTCTSTCRPSSRRSI